MNHTFTITRLPHMFTRVYDNDNDNDNDNSGGGTSGMPVWNGKIKKVDEKISTEYYSMLEKHSTDIKYNESDTYIKTIDLPSNLFIDYVSNKLREHKYQIRRDSIKVEFHSSFPEFLLKNTNEYIDGQTSYGHYRMLRRTHKDYVNNGEKIKTYLQDIFDVNIDTGLLKEKYMFLSRILGLVSYFCETVENIENREYTYENNRIVVAPVVPVFPKVIMNEPIEIKLSNYQLYEYIPWRLHEINKEEMTRKNKNRTEQQDPSQSQVFKVFTRQSSRFAFPPKIPRPRMDYSKIGQPLKKGGKKGATNPDANIDDHFGHNIDGAMDIDIEDKNIDKDADTVGVVENKENEEKEEDGKITEDHLRKEYEDNIIKALNSLTKRNLKPRAPGDTDFSDTTLTESSPLYVDMLERANASPGLIFGYSQFRKVEGVELFKRVLEANGWQCYNDITSSVPSQNIIEFLDNEQIKVGMRCILYLGMHITITSVCYIY